MYLHRNCKGQRDCPWIVHHSHRLPSFFFEFWPYIVLWKKPLQWCLLARVNLGWTALVFACTRQICWSSMIIMLSNLNSVIYPVQMVWWLGSKNRLWNAMKSTRFWTEEYVISQGSVLIKYPLNSYSIVQRQRTEFWDTQPAYGGSRGNFIAQHKQYFTRSFEFPKNRDITKSFAGFCLCTVRDGR